MAIRGAAAAYGSNVDANSWADLGGRVEYLFEAVTSVTTPWPFCCSEQARLQSCLEHHPVCLHHHSATGGPTVAAVAAKRMAPFGNLLNFTPAHLPYHSSGGSIFQPSSVSTNLGWALAAGDVTAKSATSGTETKRLPNVVLMVVMALLPKNFTNNGPSLPRKM